MNDVEHTQAAPRNEVIEPPLSKHDKRKFAVEIAGLLAVIVTIIITLLSNCSNGKDTASAIAQMKSIAETMQNEQGDIANQSAATVNMAQQTKALAGETKTVADATKSQAQTSAISAQTAHDQLTATNKQLSQNIDLFAAAQRPIMDLDRMSDRNKFDRADQAGIFMWIYAFKNVGVGPAFNVTYDEALSINGRPFQTLHRIGSKIDPHGTAHYSGAAFRLAPGDKFPARIIPTLRVTFHYTDALGRPYLDTACARYDEFSDLRDCSQPDRPRGRAWRRRH